MRKIGNHAGLRNFCNERQKEIETHRKAQIIYAHVGGKMPAQKELTAQYDFLEDR